LYAPFLYCKKTELNQFIELPLYACRIFADMARYLSQIEAIIRIIKEQA